MALVIVAFAALCVSVGTASVVFVLVRMMAPAAEVRYVEKKLAKVEEEVLDAKRRLNDLQRRIDAESR